MKKSAILFFLFLLAACAPRQAEVSQPVDFRTGSQGLYMGFVPNLPPPRLFAPGPFDVMLRVENRGTSPLGGPLDTIYLSGFDNTIITGISTTGLRIPVLEGRGPFVPQGGIDTVSFNRPTPTLTSLTGRRIDKYVPTILATACYSYETVASAQVCVDPNPYAATSAAKVCTPAPVATGSQGAPIAVTNVLVDASPGKTRFTINIQNVGGGDVFREGAEFLTKCNPYNPGLSFNEIDSVQVADVLISGRSLLNTCRPRDNTGHIRLTNGQAQLFCEFPTPPGQNPYLTPLNIILRYGYRQSISTMVEIRPTP